MLNKEIEKYAIWKVDSAYIEITLKSIRNRIDDHEVLDILCGVEYSTLIRELTELSTIIGNESEVTWLAKKIVDMDKCILDDLSLLIDDNSLKNSHSWELRNRKIACERLLDAYKSFKHRNKDTEALISKCLSLITSIDNKVIMGKEA